MEKLIKKYKNRRLYDMEKSQYIKTEDLQQYVMDGTPFKVVDSESGKDLTNATLLQILVEMNGDSSELFSEDLLRQLIIFSKHPMSDSVKTMLEKVINLFDKDTLTSAYLDEMNKANEALEKQINQAMTSWQSLFKK